MTENGHEEYFEDDASILKLECGDDCTLNLLKTNKLYIENRWILYFVNYISIKLLVKIKWVEVWMD